jgi:hypothetical protein
MLFWGITQCRVVILYRRFGTYRSHLKGDFLGLDPGRWDQIGCPETSAEGYQLTLRNITEQRRSHQYCGESLKSRKQNFTQ